MMKQTIRQQIIQFNKANEIGDVYTSRSQIFKMSKDNTLFFLNDNRLSIPVVRLSSNANDMARLLAWASNFEKTDDGIYCDIMFSTNDAYSASFYDYLVYTRDNNSDLFNDIVHLPFGAKVVSDDGKIMILHMSEIQATIIPAIPREIFDE